MPIVISGTNGVSGVDGTASAPALQGSDSNTGISYGTDIVAISTGGSERLRVGPAGQVGIGGATYGSAGQALISAGASAAAVWAAPKSAFMEVFTATTTWTVPAGVTNVKVTVIGGGGAGGGGTTTGSTQIGAGGGAGGCAIESVAVTPGDSITITVGNGGTGGTGTGGSGTSSSFGAFCSATGGTGGGRFAPNAGISTTSGGAGGSGSGGDINIQPYGTFAFMISFDATASTITSTSGPGANSALGLGFGGLARYTNNQNGAAARGFGAGGGGAWAVLGGGSNYNGGNGAGGVVIVEY